MHLIVSNSDKEIVGKYCWHVAFGETAEKTLKLKISDITSGSIKPKFKKQYIREDKNEKELVYVFTAVSDAEFLPSPDDKEWEKRDFEIKCWESSAKRTLSACHAMMMYRNNRTLEAADNLVAMLEWLNDECGQDVVPHEYGAKCPNCGRFFNQDHAFRKPVFCEDCGCMLRW